MDKYLKAIANRKRIDLLKLLINKELKLEVLVNKTKLPYQTVFRNISILRTAGFIESRTLYGSVYFRLKTNPVKPVKKLIEVIFNNQ